MDEVSNSPTLKYQLFSDKSIFLGRQACVRNSRGEAGDARGNLKGGEELTVQTSPLSQLQVVRSRLFTEEVK